MLCLIVAARLASQAGSGDSADESIHRFILNGLRHANKILGETVFVEAEWRVIGEYVYDGQGGRHQAFYAPLHDTTVLGQLIRPHDRIQVEQSLKYSPAEAELLWKRAGMEEIGQWRCRDEYGELGYSLNGGYLCRVTPLQLPRSPIRFACAYPTFSPDTWDQSYDFDLDRRTNMSSLAWPSGLWLRG